MSVTPIKIPESWKAPDLQGSKNLPREIWATILNFFLSNVSSFVQLKGIVSAAGTCQFFHKFLWNYSRIEKFPQCPQAYPLLAKITQVKTVFQDKVHSPTIFKGSFFQNLLAIGPGGKQYFTNVEGTASPQLYILDFSKETKTFEITSLDMQDPAKTGLKPTRIIACHPYENGFIVVFNSGFSKWECREGKPVFQNTYLHSINVEASAYKNDILYLRNGSNWEQIDIKKENFVPTKINRRDPRHPSEVVINPLANIRLDSESNLLCLYNQKQGKRFLSFVDEETSLTLLGEKNNIQPVTPSNGEVVFVSQGLLFVSYSDGLFRSIFLPTKEEFTTQFSPFFAKCLSKGHTLRAVFYDLEKKTLEVLFLKTIRNSTRENEQVLTHVSFFFDLPQRWWAGISLIPSKFKPNPLANFYKKS